MECNQVQSLLSAWLDQELNHEDHLNVDNHLSRCPLCRAEANELRLLHSDLERALADSRTSARQIPESVIAQISTPTLTPPPRSTSRQGPRLLVALAVAFLLASFLLFPGPESRAKSREAVATVMMSMGEVQVQQPGTTQWEDHSIVAPLSVESGTGVRTGPLSICEVEDRAGNVVCLSSKTKVSYNAVGNVVLDSGQVLCKAPTKESDLKVQTKNWIVTSPGGSFSLVCNPDGCRVVALKGKTFVRSDKGVHQLQQGDSLNEPGGQNPLPLPVENPTWETRWVHPLLMKKGRGNTDLEQRAKELLVRLGDPKMKLQYEQELRRMGDYAAPVLLEFVRVPFARKMPGHRRKAMEILADVCSSWAIPELIPLLKDPDVEIRAHAARGLQRLTGLTQGRAPDQWKTPDWASCEKTFQAWNVWWTMHETDYKSLLNTAPQAHQKRK